ncbi:MAG: hypothetical protein LC779_08420 [Actinobacteria bacterium]|nr:hypothetical protein [Actinomycetota bacterium]
MLDLDFGLAERTDGYCTPNGPSFDKQVELSVGYLANQAATTQYSGPEAPTGPEERVYGFLYTEYPPLVDAAPVIIERLRASGVNIPDDAVATLDPSLATAQQQAPNVVAKFRNAGVNTVIMPDAGAPLNFTHAAQPSFHPDYFVWPCAGMDTPGMARLFDPTQWERAAGLTCYDQEFNPDLTHGTEARQTEWYAQYREGGGGSEAPSPTPLVYSSLLPFLVGMTYAGPDPTVEGFRAGLDAFQPYRYDAIDGPTDDATNLLLGFQEADRSLFSDVTEIEWSNSARRDSGALQGAYLYLNDRVRYGSPEEFS